jgi:SAM-dependent methyltransferase
MPAVEIVRNQALTSFVISNHDLIQGRVLDVGCGSMPYKQLFPESEWTGLDFRPVSDIHADMCSIPVEDESFDTVFCIDALNFTARPWIAVAEMSRVLKPGGHLLLAVRTTAEDDSVYFGIHTTWLAAILKDVGLTSVTDTRERNVSLGGLFSRAEADNFWTNHTWLEGTGNADLDRFTAYLDSRYPAVTGVCAVK